MKDDNEYCFGIAQRNKVCSAIVFFLWLAVPLAYPLSANGESISDPVLVISHDKFETTWLNRPPFWQPNISPLKMRHDAIHINYAILTRLH